MGLGWVRVLQTNFTSGSSSSTSGLVWVGCGRLLWGLLARAAAAAAAIQTTPGAVHELYKHSVPQDSEIRPPAVVFVACCLLQAAARASPSSPARTLCPATTAEDPPSPPRSTLAALGRQDRAPAPCLRRQQQGPPVSAAQTSQLPVSPTSSPSKRATSVVTRMGNGRTTSVRTRSARRRTTTLGTACKARTPCGPSGVKGTHAWLSKSSRRTPCDPSLSLFCFLLHMSLTLLLTRIGL